jgi:Rrf2 family protein
VVPEAPPDDHRFTRRPRRAPSASAGRGLRRAKRPSWLPRFRSEVGENQRMHLTAKADYAVRAVVELAVSSPDSPRRVDSVARAQGIPVSFLENILAQLRSSGIVRNRRGPTGGYWLARPADEINLADIIRAVEGPLVGVRGQPPRRSNTRAPQRRSSRSGSRCGPTCARCSSTSPSPTSPWASCPGTCWR